jgi:TPR repeat protein
MRLRKWLVLSLVFLFGCISLIYAQDDSSSTGWEFLYKDIIPEEELQQKIIGALNGDLKSTASLMSHYGFGVRDYYEWCKWIFIAAENGLGEGHYLLSVFSDSEDVDAKTRGIFWLYTMVKNRYRATETDLNKRGYTLNTAKPPDDDHFPDNYLQLSETEIADCKIGALKGNGKAALLLGKYYSEIKIDYELFDYLFSSSHEEYWYRIGAQNGSPECQYELGQILLRKDDELNKIRGNFWLRQAIQNGYNIE